MRKVALVLFLAVLLPSLVLAWLAFRSLRDQQFALERQQSLLCQGAADTIAAEINAGMLEQQRSFREKVEELSTAGGAELPSRFDEKIVTVWPLAKVGFVVSIDGTLITPSLLGSPEARRFRMENEKFLTNRESVEVYWNGPKGSVNLSQLDAPAQIKDVLAQNAESGFAQKKAQVRNVTPQQQQMQMPAFETGNVSKIAAAEADFRQLVGDAQEGILSRFLQDKLNPMVWCRIKETPQLIYGALIDVRRLTDKLAFFVKADEAMASQIGVALLDDSGKHVASDPPDLQADWRHPFVATEVGELLPHWEVAVYLRDPAAFQRAAATLKRTLGFTIALLSLAIGVGSTLIVIDLRRQITLARQKTDFVSNVSHELKTPLTSIRMFSELLAEGRVTDPRKHQSYLQIITMEAARLTRLINNVLSFARMERGEQKFQRTPCDLVEIVREVMDSYQPQLERAGFKVNSTLPEEPIPIIADRDAIAQILVNLLSNAEKYVQDKRSIRVEMERSDRRVMVHVNDRGPGVPAGLESKIFEQFFRADDSLASGIQGTGLGLTLARQIARAHGGDVTFATRKRGGSCFTLELPISSVST